MIISNFFPVFLRQTNCQSLMAALLVQKRRERSIRRLALKKREKDARKQPKATMQHPYRAFGAREISRQRQSDAVAATAAATLQYQHPRQGVESCDLRKELEDRTGKGGNNVI